MQIKGDERLIYEDRSQKTTCSSYPPQGTDVCSDVILIPLNRPSVGNLTISTDDYLTLCEVQVFGGITFLFFQASDKHTYILHMCYDLLSPSVYDTSTAKMLSQIRCEQSVDFEK